MHVFRHNELLCREVRLPATPADQCKLEIATCENPLRRAWLGG